MEILLFKIKNTAPRRNDKRAIDTLSVISFHFAKKFYFVKSLKSPLLLKS